MTLKNHKLKNFQSIPGLALISWLLFALFLMLTYMVQAQSATVLPGPLQAWGSDSRFVFNFDNNLEVPGGQTSGPTDAGGTYQAVSAGSAHTCTITTAESLQCWGSDNDLIGVDAG